MLFANEFKKTKNMIALIWSLLNLFILLYVIFFYAKLFKNIKFNIVKITLCSVALVAFIIVGKNRMFIQKTFDLQSKTIIKKQTKFEGIIDHKTIALDGNWICKSFLTISYRTINGKLTLLAASVERTGFWNGIVWHIDSIDFKKYQNEYLFTIKGSQQWCVISAPIYAEVLDKNCLVVF